MTEKSIGKMIVEGTGKINKIAVAIAVSMTNINTELAELTSSRMSDKVTGAVNLYYKADIAESGVKLATKLGSGALSKMPQASQDAAADLVSTVADFGDGMVEKFGGELGNEALLAVSEAVASAASEMGVVAAAESISGAIDLILSETGIGEILAALQGIGLLIDLWNPCGFGKVVYQEDLDKYQRVVNLTQRNYLLNKMTDLQLPGAPPTPIHPTYQPLKSKKGSDTHTEFMDSFRKYMDKAGLNLSAKDKPIEDVYVTIYTKFVQKLAKIFPTYKKALLKHFDEMNVVESSTANSKWPIIIYLVVMGIYLVGLILSFKLFQSSKYVRVWGVLLLFFIMLLLAMAYLVVF